MKMLLTDHWKWSVSALMVRVICSRQCDLIKMTFSILSHTDTELWRAAQQRPGRARVKRKFGKVSFKTAINLDLLFCASALPLKPCVSVLWNCDDGGQLLQAPGVHRMVITTVLFSIWSHLHSPPFDIYINYACVRMKTEKSSEKKTKNTTTKIQKKSNNRVHAGK